MQAGTTGNSGRKSVIYELFILGELMDGPHYGYLLRDILGRLLGPFRNISWGVLYPLIRQLEQEGLIALEESGQEKRTPGGKQSKAYNITDAGRGRFLALMLDKGEFTADYPELFVVKLNNLSHLTRPQQLTVLQRYQEYLEIEKMTLLQGQQKILERVIGVPEDQQPHVMEVIDFRVNKVQAQLDWLHRKIASMLQP
jgi:DNA-binding PadR family transcriptional regulator